MVDKTQTRDATSKLIFGNTTALDGGNVSQRPSIDSDADLGSGS